jgi:hypothetical protein
MGYIFKICRSVAVSTLALWPAGGNGDTLKYPPIKYWVHACQMPARFACGACSVSCSRDSKATCRAGMSIWKREAWSCTFEPRCSCEKGWEGYGGR